jgi:hypothetical protein
MLAAKHNHSIKVGAMLSAGAGKRILWRHCGYLLDSAPPGH